MKKMLSRAQICFELAASCSQSGLVLLQLVPVFGDFLEVTADLLAVLKDFLFAGAVTDIPPELGSIFSQLLIIRAQFLAVLPDLFSRSADIGEIFSNLRFIMVATIGMVVVFATIAVTPAMGSSIFMNVRCGWYRRKC